MQALLRLERVGYSYDGDVALAGVDLEIGVGERLALLGPNGGGKTTLLGIVLGLRRPSTGQLVWSRPRSALRLGYVPQQPAFDRNFPIRVEEMVADGLLRERRNGRRSGRTEQVAIGEMLERLDLLALRRAYLTELSGGELKRALVARALVGEPDLLALDEPATSLDEPSRRALWMLVAGLPGSTTVVLATHDLAPETFVPTRALLVDRAVAELSLTGLHEHPLLCGHVRG